MRKVRALVAIGAVGCSVIAGCSSDEEGPAVKGTRAQNAVPVSVDPNAERVPQDVANGAVVEEGKVSIPATDEGKAYAKKLKPGTIMAGNRDLNSEDLSTSKNPYGFLRKVVSVSDGDPIVVTTEQAYLPDLLEGDLHWSPDGSDPSIFTDANDTITQGLRPLATVGSKALGSGKAPLVGKIDQAGMIVVNMTNGNFALDAEFEADFKIRKWWKIPTGLEKAMARLALNPKATVDLEVGATVQSTPTNLNKTWEGPSVAIPLGGPIPLTLRLRPEVTCQIFAAGQVTIRVRPNLAGRAAAGFNYQNDTMTSLNERPTLTSNLEFIGVQGQAELTGTCTIQGVVSLLAFDAVGVEGKLGPYAKLTASVCASGGTGGVNGGFTLYEEHGLQFDATGRLQVPGLGKPSLNQPLLSANPIKVSNYLVGKEDTCTAPGIDSCQGKPNGLYCSEKTENSAYECKNNQIAGGQQCVSGKKCKGPLTDTIKCE